MEAIVIITVEGGVADVHHNDSGANVVILDFDNLAEEGKDGAVDAALARGDFEAAINIAKEEV